MESLESLDLGVSKKSHRVQSWYLYEQFKSLERNQMDAVDKLKNRSYQDRILRQELSERRMRRKLYNQRDTSVNGSVNSKSSLSTICTSDLLESFCDLDDNEFVIQDIDGEMCEACSQESIMARIYGVEDLQNFSNPKCYGSEAGSHHSIAKTDDTLILDSNDLGHTNKMAEEIHRQFDELTDDLECLEKTTVFNNEESPESNAIRCNTKPIMGDKRKQIETLDEDMESNGNVLLMWSKVVSFAYQIIQLNHGNCYYDYGSQFMTAVLACDVLRRGVNKLCRILQPYVSPVNFAIDSDIFENTQKDIMKKSIHRKWKKLRENKYENIIHNYFECSRQNSRNDQSERCWKPYVRYTFPTSDNKKRDKRSSEPIRRNRKCKYMLNSCKKPSSLPIQNTSLYKNSNLKYPNSSFHSMEICSGTRVLNPMLKLSKYIDNIMNEVDDSNFT